MIKEKIQEEALKLPQKERAELAHLLLESFPIKRKFESEEEWAEELKRRVDEYENGEGSSKPWNEIKKKAKEMLDG